ncbi:MAG: ATP-binding protein [Arcticibacter sp.]
MVIKAGEPGEFHVAVIFENQAKRQRTTNIEVIDKYLTLFNSIEQGFCTIEVLFDDQDEAIDYRFLEVNPAFERETGLRNVVGKTIRQLVPNPEDHWFRIYGEVAKTGISRHFDEWAGAVGRWYDVYAFRVDAPRKRGVAMLFNDMSERKNAEEAYKLNLEEQVKLRTLELKESSDLLNSILDTSLIAMSLMEAVRDQNGCIVDFRIRMVNGQLEKQVGRCDLIGKLYRAEFPGIEPSGIFRTMLRVMETGEPQGMEYFYPFEGLNKWFSCMFVKIDDGIAATNLDISERKQAEEERFRNYLLLQQSEELAEMGSWEYEPQTNILKWSDEMYKLFKIKAGSPVSPEVYIRYVTDSSRTVAEQMLELLRMGSDSFEKTFEIRVPGQRKVLHFKAIAVKGFMDQPSRVLGITIDITSSRKAEERIRQMEAAQQREIFKVTLDTQEEERRRISESLHDGLGQLLYAVKISMNNLTFRSATQEQEEFQKAKKYAEDLLADAIRSTRRISHTLSPTILEDFGLKAAVKSICDQLEGAIEFRCKVALGNVILDKFLELAVFRAVQELLTNVVKHSEATDASAEITDYDDSVLIVVQDNGKGFDVKKRGRSGIGIASIRSKVKLLKGSFSITSSPESGTTVKIRLPAYRAGN